MSNNPAHDYRSKFPPLIINDDMKICINWDLWSAEVDQLSMMITGKKTKITEQDICEYLQGVLERLILENVSAESKLDKALLANKHLTNKQRASYIRGWHQVENAMNPPEGGE